MDKDLDAAITRVRVISIPRLVSLLGVSSLSVGLTASGKRDRITKEGL